MFSQLLVGRDDERDRLREALASARSGSGRVVLLSGGAGIGKTALVADLEHQAQASDIAVHIGYCINSETPAPYGPWMEMVSIARLSDDIPMDVVVGLTGTAGSSKIFVEIERLITSARSEHPVVLVIEDLHWADQASLDLFLALSRHIDRMPVLLIGTYRLLDSRPKTPFAHVLPELHRLRQVERLNLIPLKLSALSTLARERYGLNPADSGRLGRYLLRYAGGNPFYTGELLETLEQQGLIREHGGRFEVRQLHEAVIPPIVEQLVQARISDIGGSVRHNLQSAAVLGERFSYDHWLALSGMKKICGTRFRLQSTLASSHHRSTERRWHLAMP